MNHYCITLIQWKCWWIVMQAVPIDSLNKDFTASLPLPLFFCELASVVLIFKLLHVSTVAKLSLHSKSWFSPISFNGLSTPHTKWPATSFYVLYSLREEKRAHPVHMNNVQLPRQVDVQYLGLHKHMSAKRNNYESPSPRCSGCSDTSQNSLQATNFPYIPEATRGLVPIG
jgi:hypothetical protein